MCYLENGSSSLLSVKVRPSLYFKSNSTFLIKKRGTHVLLMRSKAILKLIVYLLQAISKLLVILVTLPWRNIDSRRFPTFHLFPIINNFVHSMSYFAKACAVVKIMTFLYMIPYIHPCKSLPIACLVFIESNRRLKQGKSIIRQCRFQTETS